LVLVALIHQVKLNESEKLAEIKLHFYMILLYLILFQVEFF